MGRPKKIDKLSRDSTAAIAAGMSYGKYMAMKNTAFFVKPPEDEVDEFVKDLRTCPNCGKLFVPRTRKDQKYCDDYCRHAFNHKKKVNEITIQKICPICGKEFTAENLHIKYCSPTCKKVGQRQQFMEYRHRKAEEAKHGQE